MGFYLNKNKTKMSLMFAKAIFSVRSFNCTSKKLDTYFSKDHEWVKVNGTEATVGISDHAQDKLGEVVYCELPDVGDEIEQGDVIGAVESVKAASDIITPLSGTVTSTNEKLEEQPGLLNDSPETLGWILKMKMSDSSELEELMNTEQYKQYSEDAN